MSPNYFHENNVDESAIKIGNESNFNCKLNERRTSLDTIANKSAQDQSFNFETSNSNFTSVRNSDAKQDKSMAEENNIFRSNSNLKYNLMTPKMDLKLLMHKSKADGGEEEEAEEDIQSIQNEINNMLSAQDAKTSPKTASVGGGAKNFNMNNHTVENVEHLLETMFQDSKPAKLHSPTTPLASQRVAQPRPSIEKLSTEAIEKILRTPSPIEDIVEEANSGSGGSHLSNRSTHYKFNAPHFTSQSYQNKQHEPPSSLVNNNNRNIKAANSSGVSSPSRGIPNTHSPPFGGNTSTLSSRSINSPTEAASMNSPSREGNTNSPSRGGENTNNTTSKRKLKKKLSSNSLESLDDSSNDSTKLEIIDDSIKSLPDDSTTDPSHNNTRHSSDQNNSTSNCNHSSIVKIESNDSNINGDISSKQENENTKKPAIVESKNQIILVENELEKMFAGIVKDDNQDEVKLEYEQKTTRGRSSNGLRDGNKRRRSSEFFTSSPEPPVLPKKKKNKQSGKNSSMKNNKIMKKSSSTVGSSAAGGSCSVKHVKDTSNDSIILKTTKVSPFIRLYGKPERPSQCVVINSGHNIGDEEIVTPPVHVKKSASFVPNKKMKQPASLQPATRTELIDHTWHCVFCKKGPNTRGCAGNPLGDLFGPYLIAVPQETHLDGDEFKRRASRVGGKIENVKKKRSSSVDVDSVKLTSGLVKHVTPEPGTSGGSSDHSPSKSNNVQYEIWFHESCITWGSGVYLVGNSLMCLEQCVWSALNSTCANCGETGASIGCVKSKCRSSVHYSCALHMGWYLDPTTFIATCSIHRDKYEADRYLMDAS